MAFKSRLYEWRPSKLPLFIIFVCRLLIRFVNSSYSMAINYVMYFILNGKYCGCSVRTPFNTKKIQSNQAISYCCVSWLFIVCPATASTKSIKSTIIIIANLIQNVPLYANAFFFSTIKLNLNIYRGNGTTVNETYSHKNLGECEIAVDLGLRINRKLSDIWIKEFFLF